ncbi:MAG: phenylalanine--tRNA ligase subunit beta [Burkholderiales bacterium]|nr:phenylalanine--tRNA ligase subunit beta [Burkholderiales bacterium]
MKISYNWLKWYIPDVPKPEELVNLFTFHVCEVESFDKTADGDFIFDIKILPDRAHDLLSHFGVAREISSLLDIQFIDPILKYKNPPSKETQLIIDVQSEKCRRYVGRIVRNIKIGPSPDWVVKHLESIGQRSINNMVDAANLVMYNCGQPTHVFDLNKMNQGLIVRQAEDGEDITTLDNKELKLKTSDLVIADYSKALAIAGIKGGKIAEVDSETTDVVLEVANFDPTSVRKTAQALNIFTDAKKRFENDLSPELCDRAMLEFSALILEMCPEASFEDIVDIYPKKQEIREVSFSLRKISKILGVEVSLEEIKDILRRYNFEYIEDGEFIKIKIPFMRFDLNIEEDIAEEIGRIMGYDKVKPKIPEIKFTPKSNTIYEKIVFVRNKFLNDGYSEVMTYVFRDKGEVEVLASASDKKFLRTNLTDGLKESLKLNQLNSPLLEMSEIKIFEIGTVFKKTGEEMHVAYADKKEIKEMKLEEFCFNSPLEEYPKGEVKYFHPGTSATPQEGNKFKPWSIYPFISRDVAVWVPEREDPLILKKLLIDNATDLLIKEPYLFDSFTKPASTQGEDGKTSYAFRLVFQSYERTLKDEEINEIMTNITNKIKEKNDWQVR